MKIESIMLKNFRQYRQEQLIFSLESDKNITIVHGRNGAGKTSLFIALNWCLYGNVDGIPPLADLVSKEAISQAQIGDTIHTSIQVTFIHNNEKYSVSRSIESVKNIIGVVSVNSSDDFTMLRIRWGSNKTELIDNPVGRMNVILPSNVRTYFLFDGEKIDNFAKSEAKDEVRYAIYNVLKLEILKRSQKHLEDVANEYRRDAKRFAAGILYELRDKEEKLYQEKNKKETRKEEIESEVKLATGQIQSINERLMLMPDSRAKQKQQEIVERELEQCQNDKDSLEREIREAVNNSVCIIGFPFIEQTLTLLQEKRRRGEIPSNIRQQFIQDILDHRECICGRTFEIGSSEYHKLIAIKNRSLSSSFEDDVLNTIALLHSLIGKKPIQVATLDDMRHKYAELQEHLRILSGELSDLKIQLRAVPQEDVRRLADKRDEFQLSIVQLSTEKGQIEMRLETIDKERSQLEKQIDEAEKNESKERQLSYKSKQAQKASDAISDVYQRFSDAMRLQIEEKTSEIFKLLISKVNHYQRVQLSEDYQLEVFDRYNTMSRSNLSAGERQVLSLSFIAAMSRISGEEAPLVMDTPFGRLDDVHRDTVTEHLPHLTDQLVLFVTDTEISDKPQKNLMPRVGAEYNLQFDDQTGCTKIERVKQW